MRKKYTVSGADIEVAGQRFEFRRREELPPTAAPLAHALECVQAYVEARHAESHRQSKEDMERLPAEFIDPVICCVLQCRDGILIREQLLQNPTDAPSARLPTAVALGATSDTSVLAAAPVFSEGVVHITTPEESVSSMELAPSIRMTRSRAGIDTETLAEMRVCVTCHVPESRTPHDASDGVPFLDVDQHVDLYLEGIEAPDDCDDIKAHGRKFFTRTRVQLPVSWSRFRAYLLPPSRRHAR